MTSTELVLQEQFRLDGPDWLADDYYLGPRGSGLRRRRKRGQPGRA